MFEREFELKMCELVDEDSNKKRRRNRAHLMLSVMMHSWQHAGAYNNNNNNNGSGAHGVPTAQLPSGRGSQYRRLCLVTTGLAFILGLLVGVMIPVCFLQRSLANPKLEKLSTHNKNNNVSWSLSENNINRINNISRENNTSPSVLSNYTSFLRVPESLGLLTNNLDTVHFPSVSFVSKTSAPMPQLLRQKLYGEVDVDVHRVDPPSGSGGFTSGVYWSQHVEDTLPKGFNRNDSKVWRHFARHTPVVKVEEGCGRMQNRLLTYDDGTKSCCRYRQNTDQIQGELFSFYLGNVLQLRNLAPSSLALVKLDSPLFSKVKPQLNLAQWNEDRAVVLTKFINKLEPSYIPVSFRTPARRLHPPDIPTDSTTEEIIELAQWSDLIVFDYLTANLDRLVNNLYNLQWNSEMMNAPAHNLAKDPKTGLLVFLDNESGLLHGYRLLEKYKHYHLALLEALCVFRSSTSKVIKELHKTRRIGELLQQQFSEYDPEFKDILPSLPEKSIKILNERIDRVYDQITMCERQYPGRAT